MHGSVILMVKRLDDELTKIFQNADCHSTDYIDKYVDKQASKQSKYLVHDILTPTSLGSRVRVNWSP